MSLAPTVSCRWMLTALTGVALLMPSVSSADPFQARATQTAARSLRSFQSASKQLTAYKTKALGHQEKFAATGNKNYQRFAQANVRNVFKSKVKMLRAKVTMLRAEAQLAHLEGNHDRAKELMQNAGKAERQISKVEHGLASYDARQASPKAEDHTPLKYPPVVYQGQTKALVPLASQTQKQETAPQPLGAKAGRSAIKELMGMKNFSAAQDMHKRMMATPSREGFFKSRIDNRHKRKANNFLIDQLYQEGRNAAKTGNTDLLQDAHLALSALQQMNGYKNPKTIEKRTKRYALATWQTVRRIKNPEKIREKMINQLGKDAVTSAVKAANRNDFNLVRSLMKYANALSSVGQTRKYKNARQSISQKVMNHLELAAKQGNTEAFIADRDWLVAYAQEAQLADRQVQKLATKLAKQELRVVKNSIIRDLDDAQRSLDVTSQKFNPQRAKVLIIQAQNTHAMLTQQNITVKTPFGRRSLAHRMEKLSAMVNKIEKAEMEGQKEIKKPGVMRRTYEKLFVSPHKRTEMPIANMGGAGEAEDLGFDVDQGNAQRGSTRQPPRPNYNNYGGAQMGR